LKTSVSLVESPGNYEQESALVYRWTADMCWEKLEKMDQRTRTAHQHPSLERITIWYGADGGDEIASGILSWWTKKDPTRSWGPWGRSKTFRPGHPLAFC
jgi:hypothetical protein